MTIELRGERQSSEHLFYTWEEGNEQTLETIFYYRHILMDRFVSYLEAGNLVVVATKLHHDIRNRGDRHTPVTYEFEVAWIKDWADTVTYISKGRLDAIVDQLLKALEAEKRLKAAEQEVTRNSF